MIETGNVIDQLSGEKVLSMCFRSLDYIMLQLLKRTILSVQVQAFFLIIFFHLFPTQKFSFTLTTEKGNTDLRFVSD